MTHLGMDQRAPISITSRAVQKMGSTSTDRQEGHIINKSLPNVARVWVVQRNDIDNFYGSHFEADFVKLQHRERASSMTNVLSDRELHRAFAPSLTVGGKPTEFTPMPKRDGSPFITVCVEHEGRSVSINVKMTHEEYLASAGQPWTFSYDPDFRLVALVSLLKAAYLTMFWMVGYRFALSAGGLLIGKDLLGKFFLDNRDVDDRQRVRLNASRFFSGFQLALRPLYSGPVPFEGTVTDKQVLLALKTNGGVWATIVFIRALGQSHAVLLPYMSDPDSVATYLDFLSNGNETIHACLGRFDHRQKVWRAEKDRALVTWGKQPIFSPDEP